jgi:hypothetical protein
VFIKPISYQKTIKLLFLILLLNGCGGGGSSSDESSNNPPNVIFTVNAGQEQSVSEDLIVTLTGDGQYNNGSISSYSWNQVSGSEVVINNASSAIASFYPPNVESNEQLTFELTVVNSDGKSISERTNVTIEYETSDLVCPAIQTPRARKINTVHENEEIKTSLFKQGYSIKVNPSPLDIPSDLWFPDSPEIPETENFVYLEYTPNNETNVETQIFKSSNAHMTMEDNYNSLFVTGFNENRFRMQLWPSSEVELIQTGYYLQKDLYLPSGEQLEWFGPECKLDEGWLAIDGLQYDDDTLTGVQFRFELNCDGKLNGMVRWNIDDTVIPPGPLNPLPSDLWEPPSEFEAPERNYVYLQSSDGDYVGNGKTYYYDLSTALINVELFEDTPFNTVRLDVAVDGDESWDGNFITMAGHEFFEVGLYDDAENGFYNNRTKGTLSWSGDGRGCNVQHGWYAIEHVLYDEDDVLIEIDVKFSQACSEDEPPLYGKIHWRLADKSEAPGPSNIPIDLWSPPESVGLPENNYMYLEGDQNDFLTNGESYLFTSSNAVFELKDFDSDPSPPTTASFGITGEYSASGHFKAMASIPRLEVGFYGPYEYGADANPAKGSKRWGFDSRMCQRAGGWFAIDKVGYNEYGRLGELKVRMSHQCSSDGSSMRSELYWRADDYTKPSGPITPVPFDLWRMPNSVPTCSEKFGYIESESADEFIGQGKKLLYNNLEITYRPSTGNGWTLDIVDSSNDFMGAHFNGMFFQDKIEVGYYSDVSLQNPAKGSISVGIENRGCEGSGWFIVDDVDYDENDDLKGISIRFNHQCESASNGLNGQFTWTDN